MGRRRSHRGVGSNQWVDKPQRLLIDDFIVDLDVLDEMPDPIDDFIVDLDAPHETPDPIDDSAERALHRPEPFPPSVLRDAADPARWTTGQGFPTDTATTTVELPDPLVPLTLTGYAERNPDGYTHLTTIASTGDHDVSLCSSVDVPADLPADQWTTVVANAWGKYLAAHGADLRQLQAEGTTPGSTWPLETSRLERGWTATVDNSGISAQASWTVPGRASTPGAPGEEWAPPSHAAETLEVPVVVSVTAPPSYRSGAPATVTIRSGSAAAAVTVVVPMPAGLEADPYTIEAARRAEQLAAGSHPPVDRDLAPPDRTPVPAKGSALSSPRSYVDPMSKGARR